MENTTIDPQLTESKITTLLENAKQAIITGDNSGASRYADEALELNAEHADAYYWKGAALVRQKNYKKAVSILTEAVVLNEFRVEYFSLLALAYLKSAQAEKANLVADRGLALQADDLSSLEIKTLSLIALFRLQEAHVVLQQVMQLKSSGVVATQPVFVTDDAETQYEQALTIDPFKTKSRLDNFNTIKMRHADYRSIRTITLVDRSQALIGFLILVSLITAVSYFFRDDATYKSFSLLIFILLWRGLAQEKAVNASTNFRYLFKKDFSDVSQKYDHASTIKGIILYVVTFAAFIFWHTAHSWIALVTTFISGGLFSVHGDAVLGSNIKTVVFKSSRKKKTNTTVIPFEQVPYDYLYRFGMHAGVRRVSDMLVKPRVVSFGLLFIVTFPLCFLLLRAFTDAIPYMVLLYAEMAVAICVLFTLSAFELFNLKIFYPSAIREFIPAARVRTGISFHLLWILLLASIAAHFWTQNSNILYGIGAIMVTMVVLTVRVGRKRNISEKEEVKPGNAEKRERLVAYLKATTLTPAPASVNG